MPAERGDTEPHSGIVTVQGPESPETKKRFDQAYQEADAAGVALWNRNEAGPYHAIPQPGADWHPVGTPRLLPHASQRGGTATMLTLVRPATGLLRAMGVDSAHSVILHLWLMEPFLQERAEIERQVPTETLPPEAERPPAARREAWLGPPTRPLPPLRLIVIWDTLAGHRTTAFVDGLLDHGIMPLSTPLSGSWLTMAESIRHIIVPCALAGQHPQNPQAIIDWLEQTVAGWNADPTPFVWHGSTDDAANERHCSGWPAQVLRCACATHMPGDPLVLLLYLVHEAASQTDRHCAADD